MNFYKKLIAILAIFGISNIYALQRGTLTLTNTLNEPVQFRFATVINGSIGTNTFRNNPVSNQGTINANTTARIRPGGISFGQGDIWGDEINFTLKKQSEAKTSQAQIKQLGHYTIIQGASGLQFSKAN